MNFGLIPICLAVKKNLKKTTKRTGLVPEIIVNYHMSAMLQFIDRYMV